MVRTQVTTADLQRLVQREERRIAHDLVETVNLAAQGVQAAERRKIRQAMKVRSDSFTMRQVKLTQFASVRGGKAEAILGIDPKPRSILAALEEGGDRPNLTEGGKPMAVPVAGTLARPNRDRRAKLFSALSFQKAPNGDTWVGKNKTCLIPGVGVFQHLKGRRAGKLLWSMADSIQLPRLLGLQDTAKREFPELFRRAWQIVRGS